MSLLLLFSGGAEAEFPNLYVRDAESSEAVPVGGLEGWDLAFLQSTTICQAPMVFSDKGTVAAGNSTGDINSKRFSLLLARVLFSDVAANCVVRVKYTDKNDVVSYSDSHTINATGIQISTDYAGELLKQDTLGAQKIALHVVSISAGTIKISLACV